MIRGIFVALNAIRIEEELYMEAIILHMEAIILLAMGWLMLFIGHKIDNTLNDILNQLKIIGEAKDKKG